MEHKDYTEIHPGTFVTRSILNNLGSPDDALKIIHIAGSNGKGSTAEFFTRILIAAGKRVGTFTSPAVYDFYDQFRIDGKPLSKDVAEKYFGRALSASDGLNPTDFEIQTAGVILAFKEEGCEWAVIECGMGGKDDATNAINKKELAVITSITLEHTAYLGETIEEICGHKAGIVKNCPAVISAFQPSEAENYFKNTGGIIADDFESGIIYDGDNFGYVFEYGFKRYELSVFKFRQSINAATAIEGAKILGISQEAIFKGIKNAKPAGRMEKIAAGGRDYILDGGHNASALEPLRLYLGSGYYFNFDRQDVTLIFGCLKDKDIDGNLRMVEGFADRIIAVECPSPRARSLKETAVACKKHFNNVSTAQSVTEALDKADTKIVVVFGSFTLLKEAKQWIDKRR